MHTLQIADCRVCCTLNTIIAFHINAIISVSVKHTTDHYLLIMASSTKSQAEAIGSGGMGSNSTNKRTNSGRKLTVKIVFENWKQCVVGDVYFDLPLDKNTYSKHEALSWIATTTKGSSERSAMIRFMVNKGYVPCTSKCLYDIINKIEEKGLPIGSNDWNKRGRPTREAALVAKKDGSKNFFSRLLRVQLSRPMKTKFQIPWPDDADIMEGNYPTTRTNLWGEMVWKTSI